MAVCPKCGYKLKLFDIKPTCPKCGINLLYHNIEERNETDAINAEIEHAHTQKGLDRAKASYSGNVFAFIRDGLWLLTILAFLLPLCKMSAAGPFFEGAKTFTAIEVVEDLMDSDLNVMGLITGLVDSPIVGKTTLLFGISIVCVVVAALAALLEAIFSFLSCSKRGFIRNVIFASVGIIASLGAAVSFSIYLKEVDKLLPGLMSGSVGFGIYIVALMFALVLAINIVIKATGGIPVKYKQCYVGRDAMKFEDFVEKYGDHKITVETVIANRDEFMPYKSTQEQQTEDEE
ncbi:MAG: hypothetical protein IJU45_00280 [Clostridia bacterium]|nr:hypothetical protein [Clostridia bacterium]